ncbi:NfeD family protein [Desulfoluna spongiiphila]|uniref:NfeD-like C-terminal, partner-binding n=2 Tax=Desulfoluna spongiiphila TaxID=419481 RepID=A0A1G5I9F8_9BACT|nr:NfeD family protein [Desulfoluna spongiiphila]SCY72742.1 NfeD-like C-terminal, partner-binding [Desulfoluna spongiiphila]
MKIALTVIVLQLLGVAAIIAEFIIPSFGLISVVAAALFVLSVYMVFTEVSTQMGYALLVADIFLVPAAVFVGAKVLEHSPVTLKKQLKSDDGATSQKIGLDHFLGLEGKAITDLRPSGVALLGEERIDVVTRGEYIEKESAITVISVTANSVIVKVAE